MNRAIRLSVSALLISALSSFVVSKAPQARAADKQLTTALTAFNQRKYGEAAKLFSAIEKTKATDASVQYYLGASALLSGNNSIGRDALSRAAVMTSNHNAFHVQALALLEKYFRCKPYCCLWGVTPPKTWRWAKSAMPIKVYISDGRMFPAQYHKIHLGAPEIRQLAAWAKSGAMNKLSVVPEFQSKFKSAASNGIRKWGWAVGERLLSYDFVSDPSKADIVVAWCPNLNGYAGWTYLTSTPKEAVIIQMSMSGLAQAQGHEEVFCMQVEDAMTHEFGHAVGLNHSSNQGDLMFPMPSTTVVLGSDGSAEVNGRITFTENDKATIRGLYSGVTGIVLPSVAGK